MEGKGINFIVGRGSVPIQAMADNKLTGTWQIEVHVNDLADEQGFMLDDIVEFKLRDDVIPTVTIETPDNQETDAELVPIAVHVEDDVAVVKMSWSSNQGDSGEITTENPREGLDDLLPLVLLEDGTNVITFTAFDQAENESEPATITVTKSDEVPSECFQVFVPGTDPIDAYTGSQVLQHELLSVSGVLPISFTLGYDSKRLKTSSTGRGWEEQLFSARLVQQGNGDIKVFWTPNRYNRYQKQTDGSYQAAKPSCQFDKLIKQPNGYFTLTRQNGRVYQFNSQGKLVTLGNRQGQFVNLTYNSAGQLI
jgi:hypothetical protein